MPEMEMELFPNLYKLLTVWIATGILFFFFYKFFWKALVAFMQQREDHIMQNIESATQANETAQKYEAEANEALKQARIDSKTILDRSKNEAVKKSDEIITNAQEEAKDIIDEARVQIEREKQQARKELESEVSDIALKAAKEIIQDNLDEEKSEKIVDDFIKELNA